MNLKQSSFVAAATCALTTLIGGCSSQEQAVAGKYVAIPATLRPTHDNLTDWENGDGAYAIPVPSGWALLVKEIREVRPDLQDKYFGVAVVGITDQCLALIDQFHGQDGLKRVTVLSRYGNSFYNEQPRPLAEDAFISWLFRQSLECH